MEGKNPHCAHPSHPQDCNKPADTKHCEHPDQVDVVAVINQGQVGVESVEAFKTFL